MFKPKHYAYIKSTQRFGSADSMPLLPICIGQDYHEDEKLQALIGLLRASKKILVLVSEALYRHTIQLTSSLDHVEASKLAITQANSWLERNRALLQISDTPVVLYTWKYWLLHPKYSETRKKIEKLFMQHEEIHKVFQSEAIAFLGRLRNKDSPKSIVEAVQTSSQYVVSENDLLRCLEYLKEECAVFLLMYESSTSTVRYTHVVYPGSTLDAVDAIFRHYKLDIPIIQPQFASKNKNSLTVMDVTNTNEAGIYKKFNDLESDFAVFSEYYRVFKSCRIFLLKKASDYTRDKVANFIELHMLQVEELHCIYKHSEKVTILIFAKEGIYEDSKFSDGAWKKYLPTHTFDMVEELGNIRAMLHTSGIINLAFLEKNEVEDAIKTLYYNMCSMNHLLEVIRLFYSILLYSDGALPHVSFFVEKEKMYAAHDQLVGGVCEHDIHDIFEFFKNNYVDVGKIEGINTTQGIRFAFHIRGVLSLAKFLYDKIKKDTVEELCTIFKTSSLSAFPSTDAMPNYKRFYSYYISDNTQVLSYEQLCSSSKSLSSSLSSSRANTPSDTIGVLVWSKSSLRISPIAFQHEDGYKFTTNESREDIFWKNIQGKFHSSATSTSSSSSSSREFVPIYNISRSKSNCSMNSRNFTSLSYDHSAVNRVLAEVEIALQMEDHYIKMVSSLFDSEQDPSEVDISAMYDPLSPGRIYRSQLLTFRSSGSGANNDSAWHYRTDYKKSAKIWEQRLLPEW